MTSPIILAIDQGTTSSRAILFDWQGKILAMRQKELQLHYPNKGWVEQNANDILQDTLWACRSVMDDVPEAPQHIAGIGITNQRETTIVWDRATGRPIYNAIVWQDRRTAERCASLRAHGYEPSITAKTGLLLDPYFSALKLSWILDHVHGARARAEKGELAFGTVDSFLLWHLTGGEMHATDATNASRTMLFNIVTQQWDDDLLKLFKIPRAILPEVRDSASHYGSTPKDLFGRIIPIGGIAGDQQAALIGQACFDKGMVKSTYGTGCFALMNIGTEFKQSQNRLLTTVAYRLRGQTTYALEGSIFVAGAAVQFLRDNLRFLRTASESAQVALSVQDSNGVYFVPAFTGLGAPYWDPDARGAILGLTRESNYAHITRAALEAQAFQTLDLMDAMRKDSGHDPALIRADGGLVANEFVCQFLADCLGKPVDVPVVTETTALGAAYLAGLTLGMFKDLPTLQAGWKLEKQYKPAGDMDQIAAQYAGWKDAVSRVGSGR